MTNDLNSLEAASRVLKKKTMSKVMSEARLTQHGLSILEGWSQQEPWAVQRLERKRDALIAVLLGQQE